MKFIDLLNEKWFKTIEIHREPVEIFTDPFSKKEINDVSKIASNTIRFGVKDDTKVTTYIWPADKIHYFVNKQIKFDIGFMYELNTKTIESAYFDEWLKYKNKIKLKNKMKKLFPKAEEIIWTTHSNEYKGETVL